MKTATRTSAPAASIGTGGRWLTDPVARAMLADAGVEFVPQEIATASVDWEASVRNSGRHGIKLDPVRVEQYADVFRSGKAMPELVVNEDPAERGQRVAISGVHRGYGARAAGLPYLSALMCKISDAVVLRTLPMRLNTYSGVNLTDQELLIRAAEVHDKFNLPANEAAAAVGVAAYKLREFLVFLRGKDALRKLGMEPKDFPDGTVSALARLENETVLPEAAKLVRRYKLSAARALEVLRDVRAHTARREADGLERVGHWRRTLAQETAKPKGGSGLTLSRRASLLRQFEGLVAMFERAESLDELQITDAETKNALADKTRRLHKQLRHFGLATR